MTAARWAQQHLLDDHPRAELRVYAIWFNMYPGDARSKWPGHLLTDSRVVHYWDRERVVGTRYLSHLPALLERRAAATMAPTDDALWDAFFVYEPGATWQEPVPVPLSWGYPIMLTRDQLTADIEARIGK